MKPVANKVNITDSDSEGIHQNSVDYSVLKSVFSDNERFSDSEDSESIEKSLTSWVRHTPSIQKKKRSKKKKLVKKKKSIEPDSFIPDKLEDGCNVDMTVNINEVVKNIEDSDNNEGVNEISKNADVINNNNFDDTEHTNSDYNEGNDDENCESMGKLSANPNWADAMAKILNTSKPKNKKILTLSRAKKLSDVKQEKPKLDFEIIPNEDTIVDKPETECTDEKKPDVKKAFLMRESYLKGRVKPSVLDKDRERTLSKIATRGVVQLFNIVRQQQKTIDDDSGLKRKKNRRRAEKILNSAKKKQILDTMTSSIKSTPLDIVPKQHTIQADDDKPTWLRLI